MTSLRANMKFSGYDLRRLELEYTRTVCVHSGCVKYVPVVGNNDQNTVYGTGTVI